LPSFLGAQEKKVAAGLPPASASGETTAPGHRREKQ
jgi:hypothetical protein